MGTVRSSTERFSPRLIRDEEHPNPYASPALLDEPLKPLLPAEHWPLLRIQVGDAQRYAMRRTVVLTGDIDAEIRYDGWVPNELVLVNGCRRFSGGTTIFGIVSPFILFELETPSFRVPARVDVAATFSLRTFLRLWRFSLSVAGHAVYSDNGA